MKKSIIKTMMSTGASVAVIAMLLPNTSYAQSSESAVEDEIVTIGTRRQARSAADTPAPIDVISGVEFTQNASNDVQDLLRTAVPSFNVNAQPISDASSIIRPANLRGLSPDNTLVLVNGKRRHRGSVIAFIGGGIADGAQAVDISAIPSLALKQVEVLRDGASSQYGSDAIAGVINFVLNDSSEGGTVEVQYGSTYEGDGDNYRIAGNIGLPLGERGFVNLTAEYGESDGTIRGTDRNDVLALIDNGIITRDDFFEINQRTDELVQYWGRPDVEDDIKLFVNSAVELNDNAELYAVANYSSRTVEGGFFFRNPTSRGGLFTGPTVDPLTGEALSVDEGGVRSVLVGDIDGVGVGESCPAGIPLTNGTSSQTNATIQALVNASENCFSFNEPGAVPLGFVPRFGGDNTDFSISAGLRGDVEFGNGLNYDLSFYHGSNETDFFINNTLNGSLGPQLQRDFDPGAYEQKETILNADFSYGVPVDSFASDLNIAFGAEYRNEEFTVVQGEPNSFTPGIQTLVDQGFAFTSNGFSGFSVGTEASQDSYAGYIDLEADVTEALTLQGALRYEDFSSFGDTLDYKIAGLYRVNDNFRLRGTYSTGFHAPSAGQVNVFNVTTNIDPVTGLLVDEGTIPLSSAPGQLAADVITAQTGERPTLGAESARNISLGAAFDVGPTTWTVDYYNINVDDRIALGADIDFLEVLNNIGDTSFDNTRDALNALDAAGTINLSDFGALADITNFRFFENSFGTRTQGIDVVGRLPFEFAGGQSILSIAANYNDTEVTDNDSANPLSARRVRELEELLPEVKGNVSWSHTQDKLRGLLRVNYFGSWVDGGTEQEIGSEFVIDAEIGYEVFEGLELIAGANNLFDNFPDENTVNPGSTGELYYQQSPFGFDGGQYYFKARYNF